MATLVDRLHAIANEYEYYDPRCEQQLSPLQLLCVEAADEIERLAHEIDRMKHNAQIVLDENTDDPVFAISCLYKAQQHEIKRLRAVLAGYETTGTNQDRDKQWYAESEVNDGN